MKLRSSAISTTSRPSVYGPGLPIGGDYGTILTYFVNRGRPTNGFYGMAPSKAVVGVEAFFNSSLHNLEPVVYLFLDQSMVAESYYYVYRYLYGTAPAKTIIANPFSIPVSTPTDSSPPANTGPVSGSPGPLTLISSNVMVVQPNNGYFCPCVLPRSSGAMPLPGVGKTSLSKVPELMGNPMLVQISLGNAPVINVKL